MPDFSPSRIKLRTPGTLAKTTYANEIATALNNLSPSYINGTEGPKLVPTFFFIGKIAATGPNGEADYTDNRYWVKPQYVKEGNLIDLVDTDDTTAITVDSAVTCTNLAEKSLASHALVPNAIVHVFVEEDAGGTGRYVFFSSGSPLIGQYQGMVREMVTQNVEGFAFLQSHALDP